METKEFEIELKGVDDNITQLRLLGEKEDRVVAINHKGGQGFSTGLTTSRKLGLSSLSIKLSFPRRRRSKPSQWPSARRGSISTSISLTPRTTIILPLEGSFLRLRAISYPKKLSLTSLRTDLERFTRFSPVGNWGSMLCGWAFRFGIQSTFMFMPLIPSPAS